MKLSYDKDIYNKSAILNNNSRSFFGNSSKLENLQNLYFHLNPYSNSTSIKSNQQIKDLQKFQNQTEPDSLERKYAQPNVNNYKRFHFKAEELKKGKKFNAPSPYSPVARDNPNLAFYSVGDLATLHPLTYQKMKSTQKYINSNAMKNNMRIQIVEEKMRKLEEKNDGLQILNNIFFDSLKDNITQSLKRKAFIKRHLKDIEYLKNTNIDEYNDKVEYLNKLIDENNIDFDNYDDNGEPLSGVQNLEGKIEAMKTEIGTLLTKNTMKNDANLNVLRKDVDEIKKQLEDKLIEFNLVNNKNFEILQDYLCREEENRLNEKKYKEEQERIKREKLLNAFTPSKNEKFQIKGIKKEKIKKKRNKLGGSEESEESDISTESNKDLDVIDKMFLDSMTVTVSETEKNTSSKKGTTNTGEENEIDLRSENSKTIKDSKNKGKKQWKLLQKDNDTIDEENDDNNNNIEGNENNIIGSYKSNFKSDRPEIQSKRSKKSKRFKISKETEEEENEDEDKKEDEKEKEKSDRGKSNKDKSNKEINIEGSYNKSDFYTYMPEMEKKSKRSQNSKQFNLSKDSKNKINKIKKLKENEENLFSSENQKSEKSKSKSISKKKPSKEEESEEEEEEKEDKKVEKTISKKKTPTPIVSVSSSVYTESFKLTKKTGEKLVNLSSLKEGQEVYLDSDISNLKSNNNDKKSKKSRKSKKSKKSKKKSQKSKTIKEESDDDEN